ncbi:MAG: hypothetical protein ACXV7J_14740 [Methylomonas sp.]
MTIDLLMGQLLADLRFCLENPTDEARRSLLETLEDSYSVSLAYEESSRWWMMHLSNAVRLFAQHPTKLGYQSLVRSCQHYIELVSHGHFKPHGMRRVDEFTRQTDWWFQMLQDRMVVLINKPDGESLRTFKEKLEEFCRLKKVEL